MPLEDIKSIDIVARDPAGNPQLVVTDSGVTPDPEERLQLLLAKLTTYLRYIFSDEFAQDHPQAKRESVRIKVMCALPPTGQMKEITEVSHPKHQELPIPVSFEVFAGEGGPAPSTAATGVDQADYARGLAKVRNIAFIVGVLILVGGTLGYINKGKSLTGPAVTAGVFLVIGMVFAVMAAQQKPK